MNIQNHVTVVRYHALTVFRATTQFHQFAGNRAARHWDHFNRQWEVAEDINLLGGIRNTDKLVCHGGDDFLARQCRTAALDHLHMAVDLIRAVDINPQAVNFVQIEHGDTQAFQFFRGCIGA